MGACCSKGDHNFESLVLDVVDECDYDYEGHLQEGANGSRIRLRGSSKFVSMFTQQGRKGVNQDSMTVWENFGGEKDAVYCGVFDGHGPQGHKVARQVRELLPSKISAFPKIEQSNESQTINGDKEKKVEEVENVDGNGNNEVDYTNNPLFTTWKAHFLTSFKEVDEQLRNDSSIDSYCSGSTAVTLVKKDEHLIIANLGDSRAVLCTRGDKNQPLAVQLTVDLKPNLPGEAERIRNNSGRVFALEEEPEVFRVWMPEEDCPGLAMARAFGDFCLKEYGLISTPEVSYRKLTDKDEFVVLATDGVWDVLTNSEVVRIVASARKRSMAARLLVDRAVRAWRYKYPRSKVDDCAVVVLFLKDRPLLTKSWSEASGPDTKFPQAGLPNYSTRSLRSDDGLTMINNPVNANSASNAASNDDNIGLVRGNSVVKLPSSLSRRRQAMHVDNVEPQI